MLNVDALSRWMASLSGAPSGVHAAEEPATAHRLMKDGSPFGLAGLWENWRNPNTGKWERTFAIITVPSNELVRQVHDRMPAILEPNSYERWLGVEPDPHDLLITYPSEPMTMWAISTRVNKPENDDPSLLDGYLLQCLDAPRQRSSFDLRAVAIKRLRSRR